MLCDCAFRRRLRSEGLTRLPARLHYLDYCATTPVDRRAVAAFERSCLSAWGNPSSPHPAGGAAADRLEDDRATVARTFGVASDGLRFCSSGSEALHAALQGYASRHPRAAFVSTAVEHAALRAPLRMLRSLGREVVDCPPAADGGLDLEALDRLLAARPGACLAYAAVHHETGALRDCREIADLARRRGAFVLMDAVQAAGRLDPGLWAPHADAFAVSAHKLCAPKGSAALWLRPPARLARFRFGGGQEGGSFPGTENAPGIAAFAEACRVLGERGGEDAVAAAALEKDFLRDAASRGLEFRIESPAVRAPGILCVSLPWAGDMEALLLDLARRNVCVSRFSACGGRVAGPSRALLALGAGRERAERSLRISWGRFTVREDLLVLGKALRELQGAARPREAARP